MKIIRYVNFCAIYLLVQTVCLVLVMALFITGIIGNFPFNLFFQKNATLKTPQFEDESPFDGALFWLDDGGPFRPKTEADPHEFPWVVYLKLKFGKNEKMCCGAIIHEKWVLTAAHCLYPFETITFIKIVAGMHKTTWTNGNEQFRGYSKFIIHKNFTFEPLSTDIALIELDESLTLNQYVQVIPMAEAGIKSDWKRTDCVMAGWGEVSYGKYPQTLMKANIMEELINATTIDKTCFSNGVAGRGDSGTPLVCQLFSIDRQENVGPLIFGVASQTRVDNGSDSNEEYSRIRIDEFTNTVHHIPWIGFHTRISNYSNIDDLISIPEGIEYNYPPHPIHTTYPQLRKIDFGKIICILLIALIAIIINWCIFYYFFQRMKKIIDAFELFV